MHKYRTHNCDELRTADAGKLVKLSGWVFRKRDHGSLLFFDLRDHYGMTQIVIRPDQSYFEECQKLKLESVITVTGMVEVRTPDTINPEVKTGEIEIVAQEIIFDSVAEQIPFQVSGDDDTSEELRLKYRFLDLRREKLHSNIMLRTRVISEIRKIMIDQNGFNEFQTPILTSSSPEGARDYLVPSRVHPGKFYALPQSPQQFKQLLMLAGFDKYFQIASCFRDEDARADRSPGEHSQLDIEMSFVEPDDIFKVVESVLHQIFTKFGSWKVDGIPFKRIKYSDSMLMYGSDKPDLRNPIIMSDATEIFRTSGFKAFKSLVEKGAVVRAIPVRQIASKSRSFFDKLVEYAISLGAKGLAYLVWENGEVKGPIAKFLSKDELASIAAQCALQDGDVVFLLCDNVKLVNRVSGDIRIKLGRDLDILEKDVYRFCWIVDFPMYEFDEESQTVIFSHNPFSMPQGGIEALNTMNPVDIKAFQYDVVCNGCEVGSGAIRNHKPEIMYKAFDLAGYKQEDVDGKFPALINAFKLGAPPHGGIAPGIDRIVMLLANVDNIREVIAFPMNQKAQDLLMGAPGDVTLKQLRELHIKINLPEKPKILPTETAPSPVAS